MAFGDPKKPKPSRKRRDAGANELLVNQLMNQQMLVDQESMLPSVVQRGDYNPYSVGEPRQFYFDGQRQLVPQSPSMGLEALRGALRAREGRGLYGAGGKDLTDGWMAKGTPYKPYPSLDDVNPERLAAIRAGEDLEPGEQDRWTPGASQPAPEARDLWNEYHDFQESLIKEGAETVRTSIKDYQDFGLEQLGLDQSALGVQIEAQEAQTIGLMQEQEEIRRADYEMLTEGQGGDVSAQNIYLAELGIDDPALFTTEPANESAALLGASYRAGAEVGRIVQHQVNFAANSLNSIVASGFSESRQDLLWNVMQQGAALDRYVSENLAKVELARMQKKIDDEQASDEAKALADYAIELVPMLGLNANLIMAMEKYDILDPYVDQLWAPDEEQYYSVDPMNPDQMLANDQIESNLDIYRKFLGIIGSEEELKGMYDYDIRR